MVWDVEQFVCNMINFHVAMNDYIMFFNLFSRYITD